MLKNFQAFQMAKEIHWECKNLRISTYLQDQMLRASASVALNIAEGSGKRTSPEQKRYYGIALGSLRECQAILELEKIDKPALYQKLDRLGAVLFTLCRKISENRTDTEPKPRPRPKLKPKLKPKLQQKP